MYNSHNKNVIGNRIALEGFRKRREQFFINNEEIIQIETLAKICGVNKSEMLRILLSILNLTKLSEVLEKKRKNNKKIIP